MQVGRACAIGVVELMLPVRSTEKREGEEREETGIEGEGEARGGELTHRRGPAAPADWGGGGAVVLCSRERVRRDRRPGREALWGSPGGVRLRARRGA